MKLNEKSLELYATSPLGVDKKGYLNKKGELNTEYQRRWFVLKGNLLYYFDRESDKKPNGVIILDSCSIELTDTGVPHAFQIVFSGQGSRNYLLAASSKEEMEEWMKALTLANFSYINVLVESCQMKLENLMSRERCFTESANKRKSKLRPFSTLQPLRETRASTHTSVQPVAQPTKPPRKSKEERKVTNVQPKISDIQELERNDSLNEPCCSGISPPPSQTSSTPNECNTLEYNIVSEPKLLVDNLVPVDVNAMSKSRSDTSGSESESTFYTVLPSPFNQHYFTPPEDYLDRNDPLCEEEIFDIPINRYSNADNVEPDVVATPRNGTLRSRIHHLSKSERRPSSRRTGSSRFHPDMDLWTSSDDLELLRSRSMFLSLHESFGLSIWVKVQNFEGVLENLMKQSTNSV